MLKKKWNVLCWGVKLALQIDQRKLTCWLAFSVLLSVLPAIALGYNRAILAALSNFLATGVNTYAAVQSNILFYGAILTLIALSARFNDDMLYVLMYDSYYLGLEDVMMTAAQKIPLSKLMEKKTNDDYFAAISRCGALTDLTSSGCMLLSRLISILSLLAVAVTVSPLTAGFAAVYLVFALWLNFHYSKSAQVVWAQLRQDMRRSDYLEKLVRESDPAKETRLYDSLAMIDREWSRAYQKVEDTEMRSVKAKSKIQLLLRCGFYLFLLFVMLWAIVRVSLGEMTPDLALMLFTMCVSFADVVGAIPQSYQRLSYGLYGLDIQKTFFDYALQQESAEEKAQHISEDTVFEAKDVSFAYGNGRPVLNHLNFKIRKGESIALVGTNGAGKSTLIKLLLGLYSPTEGSLICEGQPYMQGLQEQLAQKIGSFFQDYYLFHLTVGENVGAGDVKNIDDRTKIEQAIQEGGAERIVAQLPKKMDNLLGVQVYKEGAVLSGGEQQRIAVSRAFMSDKEILVFDEPASMLDPVAELKQFENIQKKVHFHTSILVSHRVGFARLADRIFVLDGGTLAEVGTHEELLKKGGIYAKLFHEQAQWYQQGKEEI